MSIIVFLSHKDTNSIKLFTELEVIENSQQLFKIVDIKEEKTLIKKYNIKRIPSMIYNNRTYIGMDAMNLVKEFQTQFPSGQGNKNSSGQGNKSVLEPQENKMFADANDMYDLNNFNSGMERDKTPVSSCRSTSDSDLSKQMEEYANSRSALENQLKKN
jgi:hypothetical protein